MRVFFCALILFILSNPNFAQSNSALDTVEIYKNKSSIGYKIYMCKWFGRSYSYTTDQLNQQDSIVLINDSSKYFKVHDECGKLWFEGATNSYGFMVGDIKWFGDDGHLDRIVSYSQNAPYKCCSDSSCAMFETPQACRWKYYRKNGLLKKEKVSLVDGDDCYGPKLKCYRRITRYNKKGAIRSQRTSRITFRRIYWSR